MAVNSAFPTVLFPASLLPTMAVMPSRRIEALLILPRYRLVDGLIPLITILPGELTVLSRIDVCRNV